MFNSYLFLFCRRFCAVRYYWKNSTSTKSSLWYGKAE